MYNDALSDHDAMHNTIYMRTSVCVVCMCSATVRTVAVTIASFTKLSNCSKVHRDVSLAEYIEISADCAQRVSVNTCTGCFSLLLLLLHFSIAAV
jgi:hypothetical protein